MASTFGSGYLIGIGSNLSPQINVARVVEALAKQFGHVHISRVLLIPPVGMNSQFDFLNLVAVIETDWASEKLKAFCNETETRLGRDRNDPDRKHKDRPADLDILMTINSIDELSITANQVTDEYFLYPLIDELFGYLLQSPIEPRQQGVVIHLNDSTFGEAATTIYRDTTAS